MLTLIYFFKVQCWRWKRKISKIMQNIHEIPQQNAGECEEKIRNLYKEISGLEESKEKEQLGTELRKVASFGLHKDLQQKIKENHLTLEGLTLVLKYMTDVPNLATYLYKNSSNPVVLKEDGLFNVSNRLGPHLEVLGGLNDAKIDVSKTWAKELYKKAPSLQALARLSLDVLENCCQGAEEGEMEEVYRLIEIAESSKNQLAAIPQDKSLEQEIDKTRAVDEKKLKIANDVMKEVEELVKARPKVSDKDVNNKLADIIKTLELPSWKNNVEPEKLIPSLQKVIQQHTNVLQSVESYKSEIEIVTKASAGRAIFGIYHSSYEPSKPAGRPLLLVPTAVTLSNPSKCQETKFLKFAAKGTATKFFETVESSSINASLSLSSFQGLLAGELAGGRDRFHTSNQSLETKTFSASALRHYRVPMKSFHLKEADIKIPLTAKRMAKSIIQNETEDERETSARQFLERYGSHYPAGVQTLGGDFFSIVDVNSTEYASADLLAEKAVKHIKMQIATGVPEIGAGVVSDYTNGNSKGTGNQGKSSGESFTYYSKSIGPSALDPETFDKLLRHKSTWALIDRGEFAGYKPVWELIKKLGGEFKKVCSILEKTWKKDENRRKEEQEKQRIENKKAQEEEDVEQELQRIKQKHIQERQVIREH